MTFDVVHPPPPELDRQMPVKISSADISVAKRMSSLLEEDAAEVAQHIRVFHHVSAILGRKKGTWKKMHFYLHRTLPDPITQATVCTLFLPLRKKNILRGVFKMFVGLKI